MAGDNLDKLRAVAALSSIVQENRGLKFSRQRLLGEVCMSIGGSEPAPVWYGRTI